MLKLKRISKTVLTFCFVTAIVACSTKEQHTGTKGLQQKIKDEQTLAKKKQNERCEEAQFRWMEAQAADDQAAIALAKRNVDKHCAKD